MLTTILAVRDELRERPELSYIRDIDIAIVPSLYHLPGDAPKFPCIAVKDGKVVRREMTCGVIEWQLPVHVVVYTNLQKDQERSVVGDVSTGQPGILTVARDVCAVLANNLLGLEPMIQDALITDEGASETYIKADESGTQRKQITITYTKETDGTCGN